MWPFQAHDCTARALVRRPAFPLSPALFSLKQARSTSAMCRAEGCPHGGYLRHVPARSGDRAVGMRIPPAAIDAPVRGRNRARATIGRVWPLGLLAPSSSPLAKVRRGARARDILRSVTAFRPRPPRSRPLRHRVRPIRVLLPQAGICGMQEQLRWRGCMLSPTPSGRSECHTSANNSFPTRASFWQRGRSRPKRRAFPGAVRFDRRWCVDSSNPV